MTDAPAALQVVAVAPGYAGREPGDTRWLIYLDGPIDAGATARIVQLILAERISSATVYLNSPGGSLVTAMQLGRVLREHGLDTYVGARTIEPTRAMPGTCDSACPFVLAGGVRRRLVPGSEIGIHSAENRVPPMDQAAFERQVAADVGTYLGEMGIGAALADVMAVVPHDQILRLTPAEALGWNLLTSLP